MKKQIVVLLVLSISAVSFGFPYDVSFHETIEAIGSRNYQGITMGDADADIDGSEFYLTWAQGTVIGGVAQYYQDPCDSEPNFIGVGLESAPERSYRDVLVADVDPDVAGNEIYIARGDLVIEPTTYGALLQYRDTGVNTFAGVAVEAIASRNYWNIDAADIDPVNGSQLELYFCSDAGGGAQYYKPSGGGSWVGVGVVPAVPAVYDIKAGEFDDTKAGPELLAARYEYLTEYYLDGTWEANDVEVVPSRVYNSVAIGELGGAGNWAGPEIMFGANSAVESFFTHYNLNDPNVIGANFDYLANTTRTINSIDIGDIDGDGQNEVVAAATGNGNMLAIYKNINGTWQKQVIDYGSYFDVELHDVDGDGDLDILYAGVGKAGIYYLCDKPQADISDDCLVDMYDFAIMASEWLDDGLQL